MKEYIKTLLWTTFVYSFFPAILLWNIHPSHSTWLITFFTIALLSSYSVYHNVLKEREQKYNRDISTIQQKADNEVAEATRLKTRAEKEEVLWRQTLLERNSGFKTLLSFISHFEKLRDEPINRYLSSKSHPAFKAADVVKEQTRKRREADFHNKRTQAIIEMYEQYAPFLIDLKDDIPDIDDVSVFKEYNEEERQDTVVNYLTKEEYRKLPTAERNQLALDRFWDRPKSKWLIGKLYERYVGFLYEQKGYKVQYFGIDERYEDMGRDLICYKGDDTLIIQCKNWAEFRTIYEKHIFQLFGTIFEYKETHLNEKVRAIFCTTTQLSPLARKIATTLGIELFESFKFDRNYPCIKCNISTLSNEKIYHLPFDQKYDDTKIDRKGEMYCSTVKEAEDAGFRRAFRWQGEKM